MNTNNKRSALRIWLGGGCIIATAAIGLASMMLKQKTALAKETYTKINEIKNGPAVKAIKAGMSSADKGLVLIGEARPFQTVTLYAKTSGYMNKILVDKGDRVKDGQLLATIISPETDQAYKAAVADLENKKKILKRDQTLVQKDYISKEDAETSETSVQMAEAQVQSLKEQMEYKNITAPFTGTITARFADPGALVQNATGAQTSAQPVVTISQLDKIRIYVYISQTDAAFLREGYPVTITMTERPDMKIKASVTRIAGELDPKTRMMLAEIDLPNKEDEIIPGSYLQVIFQAPEVKYLTIPAEALVIRGGKFYVPVITSDSEIHYQPVVVNNNDGVHVALLSGINTGDIIGLNVSPELPEGQKVSVQF
jgi:membrane fusion protein, multidrug efflux system